MKGNRIDELFRNGLESHKAVAPASAWGKLDAALPQKSKKGAYFWLSIAASIVLLATIGWLAFNIQSSSSGIDKEVLSEQQSVIDKSPKAQHNERPETTAPNSASVKKVEIIEPVKDRIVQLPALVAQNDISQHSTLEEKIQESMESMTSDNTILKIDLVKPTTLKPQFLVNNLSLFNASINSESLLEEVILTEDEFNALETETKKRSGLLNSIVSVAKGVNSGTKALSEIRKSKNEFVSKDLKYGTKTDATAEDIEDGPEEKQ